MCCKSLWWQAALSSADNVSTTRICFLAANAFVFVMAPLLWVFNAFTLEAGWFLLGIFTAAWSVKGGQKYIEVKRELNKHMHYNNNSFSGRNAMATRNNQGT